MRTFWRLLGFLRPYRGGVIVSFVLAAAAMGMGVLVPVPRRPHGRRHPRRRRRTCGRSPSRWSARACCGSLFSVTRRLVAGRVSLGVEYDLRNRMYEHLHSLELAFFDAPADGPAHVALDRGPPGGALLPRLRADLHRAVGC